ncbi:putative ribonuclease H-like domain-containing protein [Tanacetum coccineum]
MGRGHSSNEIGSSQDYILMRLWKDGSLFDSSSKIASNDEPQPSGDAGKKNDEGDNATLEATHSDFFGDETEVDMSNITTTYPVLSTTNIRIHKDHSLDYVIGDIQSGVQIRRMIKTTNEQGFISAVYEGKIHEDLHTCVCLFSITSRTQEVARIEAIRLFLAYASFKDFVVYQMDVKSAFLYSKIKEEVYVCQPLGFEDLEFPDRVMQKEDGIFISQDKYVDEFLKKFGFSTMRIASTPIETSKPLVKDAEAEDVDDSPFNLEAYSDSDYAGASLDKKSTTGGCQFLRSRLISWQCKKQTIVANSTTRSEYVAAANCCGQVLWIQNQMLDYGYNFLHTKIFIDNESTICIIKNPVFHSNTKHIKIRHHFIRDSYEKRLIQVIKIHTDHNVADLLTKALDVSRFQFLTASIGMLNL